MPGRDGDGRGVPPAYSFFWHLCRAAGSHRITGDQTVPTPCYPWDTVGTPWSTHQGPAIGCQASLRSQLPLSCSSVAPCTAKQPCSGATAVTTASALPLGARLLCVPVPGCFGPIASTGSHRRARPMAGSSPTASRAPSPHGTNKERNVLASTEKTHVINLGYLEPI